MGSNKKWFSFEGRASRSDFSFLFFLIIIANITFRYLVFLIITKRPDVDIEIVQFMSFTVGIAGYGIIFPTMFRRLHDIGVSGLYLFIPWVSLIISLILLNYSDYIATIIFAFGIIINIFQIILLFWKGSSLENKYGPPLR